MKCSNCLKENQAGAKTCQFCGVKLSGNQTSTVDDIKSPGGSLSISTGVSPDVTYPSSTPSAEHLASCPDCGFSVQTEEAFCGHCGRKLVPWWAPLQRKLFEGGSQRKRPSREEAQVAWQEWEAARQAGQPLPIRKGTAFKFNKVKSLPNSTPTGTFNPFGVLFSCAGMSCGGVLLIVSILIIAFFLMVLFSSGH